MSFHPLCRVSDVPEGGIAGGSMPDGRRVAIYNVNGAIFVTDDRCTHGDASLVDEGVLEGCIVECPLHFGSFDVTTGEAKAHPCTEPLNTYRVDVRDGEVYVEIVAAIPIAADRQDAAGSPG
jgi:nitrite reductase/ring-hydroxylating ferredoxin subunit